MAANDVTARVFNWRIELPTLCGSMVTLREPVAADAEVVLELLSLPDATRFDLGEALTAGAVKRLLDRVVRDRVAGVAFTYAIALTATEEVVGLMQVRRLDPLFEGATWDCTLAVHVRGTAVFGDAAHLAGSFAFASTGVRRLEVRIDVDNARAKFAIRKIGGVQEGVLRRAVRRGSEDVDQSLWAVLKETWAYVPNRVSEVVH
jgi:ribosomal-protein-alanine N-acetyltransferase